MRPFYELTVRDTNKSLRSGISNIHGNIMIERGIQNLVLYDGYPVSNSCLSVTPLFFSRTILGHYATRCGTLAFLQSMYFLL